jgi:eukaryotic-like serine/threonine-protein kinase
MGSVWVAEHLGLHTQVVVKFIADELVKNPDAIARFTREAAAASQVKSPHVVQTLDHGVRDDGIPFIVMEHLEGHDLSTEIERHGKLDKEAVLTIVTQLGRALVRAHERGIVHRDIKPSNVFLCDAGGGELFVKLLDFGIAKGGDVPKLDENTRTGSMVGSPHYMSPEQIIGDKNVDFRTDLWSLGVVVFEAMTGIKPFEADTIGGLALKIHNEALPKPSSFDPSLPKSVDAWFARACAREPSDRFVGAREMADALGAAFTGHAPAPVPSFAPRAPADSPSHDLELAKTALSPEPASMRSGAELKSSTGIGVSAAKLPAARSRWWTVAVAGVVLVFGAVGVSRLVAGPPRSGGATADPSPRPSGTEPAPTRLPDISPSAVTPSLSASTAPSPSASVKPLVRPTAVPAKSAKPTQGSEDDIK